LRDNGFDIIENEKKTGIRTNLRNPLEMIDFTKYLNCPACKEIELYCPTHRAEVEKILESENQ